jgi:UDP-N-acetylglucosamine 4-epimerase
LYSNEDAPINQSAKQGEKEHKSAKFANPRIRESDNYYFHEVFNIANGGNTTLNHLFTALRDNLAKFDEYISNIEPEYGPCRVGDIPHSQASILKAKTILGYEPEFDAEKGFELAAKWYYQNLK